MAEVSDFDRELRECLAEVLGARPPTPEYEALAFYRHWLAERNLGLVPIDDAAAFDWPGGWLARVRSRGQAHAVVMFGSPSGPLFDPSGPSRAAGRSRQGGWLRRSTSRGRPCRSMRSLGSERWTGSTLQLTPRRRSTSIASVTALAGPGPRG